MICEKKTVGVWSPNQSKKGFWFPKPYDKILQLITKWGKYREVVIEDNCRYYCSFQWLGECGALGTQKLVKQPPYLLFSHSQKFT